MGPVAAQITITNPAQANAQVDPSQEEMAVANRPKWSCTVGSCAFGDSLVMETAFLGAAKS